MTTPKLVLCLFTYRDDAQVTMENILCHKKTLPEARIVVIDDARNPMAPRFGAAIEKLGCLYKTSTWDRRGNLRGRECILHMVDEMISQSENDWDTILKIDPDTLILNGDSLRKFVAGNKIVWGSKSRYTPISGCAYAVKAHALKEAYQILGGQYILNIAPEDHTIGTAILQAFPNQDLWDTHYPRNPENNPEGEWIGYNWGHYPHVDKYASYSIVTTTNRIYPPLNRHARPVVMNALRKSRQ